MAHAAMFLSPTQETDLDWLPSLALTQQQLSGRFWELTSRISARKIEYWNEATILGPQDSETRIEKAYSLSLNNLKSLPRARCLKTESV